MKCRDMRFLSLAGCFSHIRVKGQPHLEHLIFETLRLAIASFGTGTINSHPSIVSLPTDK
jgi:hypothetical protein